MAIDDGPCTRDLGLKAALGLGPIDHLARIERARAVAVRMLRVVPLGLRREPLEGSNRVEIAGYSWRDPRWLIDKPRHLTPGLRSHHCQHRLRYRLARTSVQIHARLAAACPMIGHLAATNPTVTEAKIAALCDCSGRWVELGMPPGRARRYARSPRPTRIRLTAEPSTMPLDPASACTPFPAVRRRAESPEHPV